MNINTGDSIYYNEENVSEYIKNNNVSHNKLLGNDYLAEIIKDDHFVCEKI